MPPIELVSGVVLHGRVRMPQGVKLGTDGIVAIVPVEPRGPRGDELACRTAPIASDGRFDVGGLAPGAWRLLVAPSKSDAGQVLAPADRPIVTIPDGAEDVSWEGTVAVVAVLGIGTWDPRLPPRLGSGVVETASQRAFAEGCEVVIVNERDEVVARQKGRFRAGDESSVELLLLSPGTYTVKTQVPGDPPKEERVVLVAGERKHVTFGQPRPPVPPPPGQTDCGKGKCG